MTTKAVAEKAQAGLPSADVMDLIMETQGDGVDFDTSELQIPFIRIIQAMSPQIKKSDPNYIAGASQGDIFNTVTGEYWDGKEGIVVVPSHTETKYLKFKPREQGGGFMGELHKDDPDIARTQRTGAKEILPDGNELVKSDQFYVIIANENGVPSFGILDMKSSALKVSRKWKTQIIAFRHKDEKTGNLVKPSLYSVNWRLSVVEESNDQGSWFNWTVANEGLIQDREMFLAAKSFRESIQSGAAKAVAEDLVDEKSHESGEAAPF